MSAKPSSKVDPRPQERMATMEHNDERLIAVLQRELDAARTSVQAAQEREARLLGLLEQEQQRVMYLEQKLDAMAQDLQYAQQWLPRTVARRASTAARPRAGARQRTPDQSHDLASRILAVLADDPTGLTRLQIQQKLNVSKHLGDTLVGMTRRGRLVRLEQGLYAVPTPPPHPMTKK